MVAEALDAAERATGLAGAVGPWALAILLIAALGWTVAALGRRLLDSQREQVSQNLSAGVALSRSAEAHERSTQGLRDLQASVERQSAEIAEMRRSVDRLQGRLG